MNKETIMITKEKALAAVIAVTIVNGFFSTNMMKKYKEMYSYKVEHLESENSTLKTGILLASNRIFL